ncbi:MAG: Smr/MutS family protein [Deltaproteobacteria bacterium]|nr:Smr/MutS family protein [Deltaproteobacteria bacterium]MBW1964931.1 Smr/MutS family protein [Deltaproteobacteria bacterium]
MQDNGCHRQPNRNAEPVAFRPFSDLGQLISKAKKHALLKKESSLADNRHSNSPEKKSSLPELNHEYQEIELFLQATKDVKPLDSNKTEEASNPSPKKSALVHEDEQTLIFRELKALVDGKKPFPVHHTPEYVEWTWTGNNPELTSRLHKGAFAVQAYCELHGMDSVEALGACEDFLAQALLENKRCVAFVHGRGLSSPGEPVLKGTVIKWLTNGLYRRFVLSFSSAPMWDGGAGVTYVLLRRRPARRRRKKTGRKVW